MRTLVILLFSAYNVLAQPYQVGHISTSVTDASRSNRSISVELYYPATTAGNNVPVAGAAGVQFPVIVFGHGFSMNYDAYGYLWNDLVPRGYIMAFPTTEIGPIPFPSHTDFGKDMAYMIGWFQSSNIDNTSPFYGKVSNKAAVGGHSMGGGCSYLAAASNTSVNAIFNFAAAETSPSAISAAASVTAPALVFSGSQDCIAPTASNQTPMYNALISACKSYVYITNASHCQFADYNATCGLGESLTCPFNSYISRTAQHSTTLQLLEPWLDFLLKGQCSRYFDFEGYLTTLTTFTYLQSCNVSTPVAGIIPGGPTHLCQGQSIQLAGAPSGLTYLWNTGDTMQNITTSVAGNYQLTVTNNYNCSDSAAIAVSTPQNPLSILPQHTDINCNRAGNGVAWAVTSGGYGSYTYLWNQSNTSDTIDQLQPGTYVVTVTDLYNCTITDSAVVTEPSALALQTSHTNLLCYHDSSGRASVVVTGGVSPYTFAWNVPGTTDSISNISSGSYSIIVSDSNNCSKTDTFSILEPQQLSITFSSIPTSCAAATNGAAIAAVSGGTLPYIYNFQQGAQHAANDTLTGLGAGTAYFIVTDHNNCSKFDSTIIHSLVPSMPVIISSKGSNICKGDSTTLSTSGGYISYIWTTGGTTAAINELQSGAYSVTVTDNNGCIIPSDTLNLQVSLPYLHPVFSISQDTLFCSDSVSQWFYNSVSQSGDGYYLTPASDGDYKAVVTDSNGCITIIDSTVTIFMGLQKSLISNPTLNVYPNPAAGEIIISGSQAAKNIILTDMSGRQIVGPFQYDGNKAFTIPLGQLPAGSYLLHYSTNEGSHTMKIGHTR